MSLPRDPYVSYNSNRTLVIVHSFLTSIFPIGTLVSAAPLKKTKTSLQYYIQVRRFPRPSKGKLAWYCPPFG